MKPSDFLAVLIFAVGGALLFSAIFISWIANQIGLPFWDVVGEARLLLSAPATLVMVMVIEAAGTQIPLRVSTMWPLIAGLFWAGIHKLITMKAELVALDQLGGSTTTYAYHVEMPWFTEQWFMLTVGALIVVGGYALTAKISSSY
ncbi:TPA: hypothetical protein L5U90_003220 [Pseudomonas aeruginosa]|nr:hypothetical protein [Pseudomonas aeruginosa]